MPLSGSYLPDDVSFLLTPMALAPTGVEEKERLIQSGTRHYSEMISREEPPAAEYLAVFHRSFAANRVRFARDVVRLARALRARASGEIVLVSLARAGTPVGVLLRRALALLGADAPHYSISIIRDRGIDAAALNYIAARHDPAGVVFIDGWTGKGAIAGELARSLAEYRTPRHVALAPDLAVVADLAGQAHVAATSDDYLIPTSVLNAVLSGLVSRTILTDDLIAAGGFHGCVVYDHLAPHDLTRWVVDELAGDLADAVADPFCVAPAWDDGRRQALADVSHSFVSTMMQQFRVTDRNRIKPGIGESTRALLRRVPDRLVLQSREDEAVEHLLLLAESRGVAVSVDPSLPYRAAVVIKPLGPDS